MESGKTTKTKQGIMNQLMTTTQFMRAQDLEDPK